MAAFVLVNKTILIGSAWTGTAPGGATTPSGTITSTTDLSSFVFQGAEPGFAANMLEVTNFGSGGYKASIPGITSGDDLQIVMNADYASSQAWAGVTGVFGSLALSRPGDSFKYIDIKPTSSARSATNPSMVFAVWAKGIQPLQGAVGDKATHVLTLEVTGAFAVLTS